MLESSESPFKANECSRRRSTFYVPLVSEPKSSIEDAAISTNLDDIKQSLEQLYNPNFSNYSFDWSLDGGNTMMTNDNNLLMSSTSTSKYQLNKVKRYGVVLNDVDLDVKKCQQQSPSNTSTPIKLIKSKSRTNIVTTLPDKLNINSPIKEKSKTLPQNLTSPNSFPSKHSFLLKSTPRISFNYSSDASSNNNSLTSTSTSTSSPKKALNFIRRVHSTKLSRNNSLLKNFTSKCSSSQNVVEDRLPVSKLELEQLKLFVSANSADTESIKDFFLKEKPTATPCDHNDQDRHSDTSYEKACRRGSAPATPILRQKQQNETNATSRFTNFFSKRSNPLKRTKSVTKLERSKRGLGGLRGSRSHESLLSSHALISTIDLSCMGAVAVAPVHQSVLGRQHCFQVRGGPRGERYYSCNSRQERDLWIYSLKKAIAPNADHTRRTDNSLKMWIYEAKGIPPKKKYFCEINLDKTLYGRTSVKLRSDLLFWGEYFDFPDIPDINVITVNLFRECDKKKKRDKHILVGSVKVLIHEVTSRIFSEDWYQVVSDKHDSISKNSSKEQIPTLRIKCRFQSIDIMPLDIYSEFLQYLKENYKKVCEILEPVIGVKAKEDIGQALVLLMHAQGTVSEFLTDVVALDLLRVGDQRLTFRGNSLATKSMEAFLKLTGEQYLQDTLSVPISEIISSDRDCEVDPLKASSGSLMRQQQSLRDAVQSTWNSIVESHKQFPPKLRECFATFRERLKMLDREDMANNLISGSIFLRFLCPAILAPSLFNLTSELPTNQTTRNLTLVAKTLQTLANFTRFQGKENFMEFLNDFLEKEAPRMKNFLHEISTRAETTLPDNILDWSGYIDQGKQLAILHNLLSESIQKLPENQQQELVSLLTILTNISDAKVSNFQIQQSNDIASTIHSNQENQPGKNNMTERGIIRGVLTPTSLEKNIFRYNDPTVSPLLKQSTTNLNQSQSSINGSIYSNHLNNSQSTSSISTSASNSNFYQTNLIPTTIHHLLQHSATSCPPEHSATLERSVYLDSTRPSITAAHHHYHYHPGSDGKRTPPVKASTLPRNNSSQINGNLDIQQDGENGTSLIPIGLDTSNAFIRKSPTPHIKLVLNGSRSRNLNGSQLSLHQQNDIKTSPTVNLNLSIPQCDPLSNSQNLNQNKTCQMPMNLEDLDDLLKYGEEHADEDNQTKNRRKDNLTAKGSNVSIGHCSSGYQSIATHSQSSSPIELGIPRSHSQAMTTNHDFINKNIKLLPSVDGIGGNSIASSKGQYPSNVRIESKYNGNIDNGHPPLAFKNPLYQLESTPHKNHFYQQSMSHKSSSLTPSSSEEQLIGDNFYMNHPINVNGGDIGIDDLGKPLNKDSPGQRDHQSIVTINNNSRRLISSNSNRLPRTNPLMHYKRDEFADGNNVLNQRRDVQYFHRYHRRLSLESARTLSDSSTDTEGIIHTDGKRRRNQRSVEQCEREIQRLQTSLDSLRNQIGSDVNVRDSADDLLALPAHSDIKMRNIISRLIAMEEDLRREQLKMSLALSHKQRVIEAQGQQIAALDAANNRLLSALSSLRQRYESKSSTNQTSAESSSAASSTSPLTVNNGNPSSLC